MARQNKAKQMTLRKFALVAAGIPFIIALIAASAFAAPYGYGMGRMMYGGYGYGIGAMLFS